MNKSLLAKLMAQEDLTVIEGNFETASFNPASRTLKLPLLKNEYYDAYNLFIGHEVGHALYTPDCFSHDSKTEDVSDIPFSILNIVEDVRIERKIRNFYPGLVNDFVKGYQALLKDNFFGIDGVDINGMGFLDRLNLRAKLNRTLDLKFTENEVKMMNKVFAIETFDDTVKVSRELMEFIKTGEEEKPEDGIPTASFGGDGEEMEDDSGREAAEQGEEQQEEQENDNPEMKGSPDTTPSNDKQEDKPTDELKCDDDPFESITDKAFREKEGEMVQTANDVYYIKVNRDQIYNEYLQTEEMLKKSAEDHQELLIKNNIDLEKRKAAIEEEYKQFITDVKPSVNTMVQQFELKKSAQASSKIRESKTGTVDVNKLWSYKVDDNIFKVNTLLPNSKNHGMLMYIDFSASMASEIFETVKQSIILSMFARRVGIPYELYSFTSNDRFDRDGNTTGNGFVDNAIKMVKVADSTWSTKKQSDMFIRLFGSVAKIKLERKDDNRFSPRDGRGMHFDGVRHRVPEPAFQLQGTPLTELSAIALIMAKDFEVKHPVQKMNVVFLTDGQPQALRLSIASRYVKNNVKSFVLDIEGVGRVESGMVPAGSHYNVTSASLLKNALFKKLESTYNFIGFFLTSIRKDMLNPSNGFDVIDGNRDIEASKGYSTYIRVLSKTMNATDDAFTPRTDDVVNYKEINDKTKLSHIKADFRKHQGKKKTNKIISQEFARLVA
jgi:hypothetical protein